MGARASASRRGYGRRWQAIVREAIQVHVRIFGWTCPGWGVASHYSTDLTGDHELALALGGLSTPANCRVLCRGCNARKGSRPAPRTQLTLDAALVELTR
jgi:5-methylcytosine-specific restriction endonuclease McrA